MTFKEMQRICKYYCLGYDGEGGVEDTCRRPDRIPPGHSWEKCREDYCPYFGMKTKAENAKLFIEGEEVGTIKELAIVMCKSTDCHMS